MPLLIMLRHGESLWNKENIFTGWVDIDLSPKGEEEARLAGVLLKPYKIDYVFTSALKRAQRTTQIALEQCGQSNLPIAKVQDLNERHYGDLQGLNKAAVGEKFGLDQLKIWRRSYDVRPPALALDDPRHPRFDHRYHDLDPADIPATEALKDTVERIVPYWKNQMEPALAKHKQIVVAAHGNSLRGILKYLKNISDQDIVGINLPTGIPYVFEFDDQMKLQKDYFLGDPEVIKKLMDEVANQGKKK